MTIDASTTLNFALWRSKVAPEFRPREWAAFDTAMQEIRYEAMAAGISGSTEIDAAVRQLVDGKSVDYVIQRGLNRKLNRYITERDEQKALIDRNNPLGTLRDSEENAQVSRSVRTAQRERYDRILEEIEKIEDDLSAVEKSFHESGSR